MTLDLPRFARQGGLPRPAWWEEERDYSAILDPTWECFWDHRDLSMKFLADLDQRGRAAGDPLCIGEYGYCEERFYYLAVRATLYLTPYDGDISYAGFQLPETIDRAAWDRLLRAKCEAFGIQWAPPRCQLLEIMSNHPDLEFPPEVVQYPW